MKVDQPLKPAQIFTTVAAQPPLMRPGMTKRYVGKQVDWQLSFLDAWTTKPKVVRLVLGFEPHEVKMVVGEVPLSSYPQLKQLRAGETLRVQGRIRSVSTLSIELDITELLFSIEAAAV